MSDPSREQIAAVRAGAAAEEREAVVQIIERSMRRLAHGHGATGVQVLQEIEEEIRRRGSGGASGAS